MFKTKWVKSTWQRQISHVNTHMVPMLQSYSKYFSNQNISLACQCILRSIWYPIMIPIPKSWQSLHYADSKYCHKPKPIRIVQFSTATAIHLYPCFPTNGSMGSIEFNSIQSKPKKKIKLKVVVNFDNSKGGGCCPNKWCTSNNVLHTLWS